MATAIYLPKVGMTMEEGTLTKWVVADGAAVKRGDVIFEMETEKVQMEIEAEAAGALKQLAAEGAVLHPGDVVGCLLAEHEEVPQDLLDRAKAQSSGVPSVSQTTASEIAATPPPAPDVTIESGAASTAIPAEGPPGTPPGPVRASPIARRLADEHGINISSITGTGPDGRIVERDVQRAIEARAAADEHTRPPVGEGLAPVSSEPYPAVAQTGGTSSPYSGRRRTTGQRMFESLSSMAQLTLVSETAVDEALTMLHGLNREWRKDGIVVTLPALIVRACALALKEHPHLNARLEGDHIVVSGEINVGVAVNQEHGLMVPVIREAANGSLKDVAAKMQELVGKARTETLGVDDMTGGTFTVTSLEGTVVDAFTPIINPPQAAILGVGRLREAAAFEGANVVKRQVTTLSLTFDHRLNDGAPASAFLERIEELLSRPYMLM